VNNCFCFTNEDENKDLKGKDGRHVLTGEIIDKYDRTTFTLKEIEVFQVKI
jgi:hypothetical protein